MTRLCQHAPYGCNLNRYPPLTEVGSALPGQFRLGPHCDFGTITVLDRQPGIGALQVEPADGTWIDMPHMPGSLAINTGDLLSLWTGGQWRSTRHRVLPPSEQVPDEELLSLVFFHTADADALIEPFGPASGGMRPVIAGDHLRRQLEAITMPAPPI